MWLGGGRREEVGFPPQSKESIQRNSKEGATKGKEILIFGSFARCEIL